MRPRNKPRIFITLHARGKNSLGENRTCLGHPAYHWGILISPKNKAAHPTSASQSPKSPSDLHTLFDVTDSLYTDPVTGEVKESWRFRERGSPDPEIEKFTGTALGFADESLKGKGEMGNILGYPGRGGV